MEDGLQDLKAEAEYNMRMLDLDSKARDKAALDILKRYHIQRILDLPEGLHPVLKSAVDYINKPSGTPPYYWVTINPPVDNIELLSKCVQKFLTKKYITDYAYVYEQRGESKDNIHGYHVHILVKSNGYPPVRFRKELQSSFLKILPNPNPNNPYIRYVKDDKEAVKILQYVKHIKKDEEKKEKMEIDNYFRIEKNLESYYISSANAFESNAQAKQSSGETG